MLTAVLDTKTEVDVALLKDLKSINSLCLHPFAHNQA